MADRKPVPKNLAASTIMGSAEPLTEEELKKLAEERRSRSLESILMAAHLENEFARVLCEKVGQLAQADAELVALLKKSMSKGKRGRPEEWNLKRYETLLIHYAHAIFETGGDHSRVLTILAEYESRMSAEATVPSPGSIDNRITEGIKALREAGLLTNLMNEVDWIKDALQARMDKGEKSKKRPTTKPQPDPIEYPQWFPQRRSPK